MHARGLLLTSALVLAACSGGNDQVARVTDPPTTTPVAASPATTTTTRVVAATTTTAAPTTSSSTTTTTIPAPTVAPDGEAAYTPPDPLPPGNPGDVIWRRPLGEVDGATSELILYHSTTATGERTAVTAAMVVPDGDPPAGGRPIVSWAHGTTGLADVCAPSKSYGPFHIVALEQFLAAGYAVVATDYEGLGTPGLHPYLVGASEAASVLDAARAVRTLLGDGASSTVVVGGHSQGGQAAVWAAQLAAQYAPDLDVRGAVALAPAIQMPAAAGSLTTIRPLAGYGVSALAGLAAAHGDLALTDVLTPEAIADLAVLEDRCMADVLSHFSTVPYRILAADPLVVDAWSERVAANDPGRQAIGVPLLVAQGADDALVIESVTGAWVGRACAAGSTVDYRVFDDADHASVLPAAEPEMLTWIAERMAGGAAVSTCG